MRFVFVVLSTLAAVSTAHADSGAEEIRRACESSIRNQGTTPEECASVLLESLLSRLGGKAKQEEIRECGPGNVTSVAREAFKDRIGKDPAFRGLRVYQVRYRMRQTLAMPDRFGYEVNIRMPSAKNHNGSLAKAAIDVVCEYDRRNNLVVTGATVRTYSSAAR